MSTTTKMRPPWHREACWECGTEGLATRGDPSPADKPYLCHACAIMARAADEAAALRKQLAEAEQRAERAEKELADEAAKAAAAVGYGSDDARWRPGETALNALIRERDAAEERIALLEQSWRDLNVAEWRAIEAEAAAEYMQERAERAERELERHLVRLRVRAEFRRDYKADLRVYFANHRWRSSEFVRLAPWDGLAHGLYELLGEEDGVRLANRSAHLRERVRLPGDSWAVLIVCDQTILYLTADGQETSIHAKAHLFDNRQGAESALREHLARIGLDETWGAVEYVPDAASFVAREDTW